MKTRTLIIIGIIIFVAVYLPIHYYYPFLGIGTTTGIFVFCEDGFIQSGNKCAPDIKISKDISMDEFANNFCPNNTLAQNETGTFLICLHVNNNPKAIFDLPAPIYMLKPCTSMHGCMNPYVWAQQIPSNLISEEQKQQAIDKALTLQQTKNWSSEPKLDHFLVMPIQDRWHANIQFFISGVKMPQHNKCEYYDSVEIDLETLEIINGFREFDGFEECKNQ